MSDDVYAAHLARLRQRMALRDFRMRAAEMLDAMRTQAYEAHDLDRGDAISDAYNAIIQMPLEVQS